MKGEFTMRILEALTDSALGVVDLVDVFLSSGYGASQGKMQREMELRQRQREIKREKYISEGEVRSSKEEQRQILKERFYQMLSRLERDGLVKKTKSGRLGIFTVTTRGKRKLSSLQDRYVKALPSPRYTSRNRNRKKLVLAIFDIPERIRHKRDWLRRVLINLDFTPIQKSVWAGKVRVPAEFLYDLRDLQLTQFVEILEITKQGSIARLEKR